MRANEKDYCGHSCFDAECQGEADPMCPVHGMTPEEAREEWKARMLYAHYGRDGDLSTVVYPPEDFTADAVREAVQRMRDAPRGHWEWRSEHAADGWCWVSEWVWD